MPVDRNPFPEYARPATRYSSDLQDREWQLFERFLPVGAELAREARAIGGRSRLSTNLTRDARLSGRLCLPGHPPSLPLLLFP